MARRNKYINTFDTTAQFNGYIESAEPGFPNVALTKDTGNIHYTSTSPNDHLIYGTLIDPTKPPVFRFNGNQDQRITAHVDALNNTFYIDQSDLTAVGVTTITSLANFVYEQSINYNILTIKKINIDTSSATYANYMFRSCSNLTSLDLSSWDLSGVNTTLYDNFVADGSLTDIYISYQSTLMLLTNNLTSAATGYPSSMQNTKYIPSWTTIHYGDVDYVWSNGAWVVSN